MKTTYLLLRADPTGDVNLHSVISADGMGEAMYLAAGRKTVIPNNDRWFVIHGYEIKDYEIKNEAE